jgi:phosphomannomutase
MKLNKNIFKSYDIRGVYPDELNEENAREISLLFLSLVCKRTDKQPEDLKIVIGRDVRDSSQVLEKILMDTLVSKGVKVDNIGLMAVDVIYFAVGKKDYDGGVMVTASHNPGEYGGYKMVSKGVEWVRGTELWDHRAEKIDFVDSDRGGIKSIDIWKDYLEHIFSFVNKDKIKPMKIVVDSGNGMAGIMVSKIVELLPQIELVPLFFEPDGSFPSRNPNPLMDNASDQLCTKVKEEKADLGFMYDADADRVFLVDENGTFLRGDQTLLVLAKPMLEKNPGVGVVYNLICSKNIPETIEKMGGKAIRSEVGYVNMGTHMKKENGIMGGEVSAHFSFRDNYYADSGFIAFLLALEAVSEEGFKLSEFIKENENWYRANEINLEIEDKNGALDKIREHYQKNILDEIDGITVEFKDWWFNVRPSNTEPFLRVTIECRNENDIEKKKQEIMRILEIENFKL